MNEIVLEGHVAGWRATALAERVMAISSFSAQQDAFAATGAVNAIFLELGKVDEEQILALGQKLGHEHPEMDTIYIPCPHFATANVIEPLEAEFGITALQAIVWRSLRGARVEDRIEGFGKLMREH